MTDSDSGTLKSRLVQMINDFKLGSKDASYLFNDSCKILSLIGSGGLGRVAGCPTPLFVPYYTPNLTLVMLC